jgi:hypothetical protein
MQVGDDEQHDMSEPEPQPSTPLPSPPFQFSLRTLLLLFVVLGSSLGVFGVWGIIVFGLVVGLAVYLHHAESFRPLGCLLAVLCPVICAGFLLPAIGNVGPGRRAQCQNNLRQIAQALQCYRQANGCFPPAYIADKTGKPIHSWRVLLLPYLDSDVTLYQAYTFSEPWDGPKNKTVACPVAVYACPSNGRSWTAAPFETSYVALVGPKGEWPTELAVTNGTNKTPSDIAMVVEVAESGIPWMEPRDLSIDTSGTVVADGAALVPSSHHGPRGGFYETRDQDGDVCAAMADGSVRYLPPGVLSIKGRRGRTNWPNIAALAVWLLSVGMLLTYAVRSRKPRSVPPPPAC